MSSNAKNNRRRSRRLAAQAISATILGASTPAAAGTSPVQETVIFCHVPPDAVQQALQTSLPPVTHCTPPALQVSCKDRDHVSPDEADLDLLAHVSAEQELLRAVQRFLECGPTDQLRTQVEMLEEYLEDVLDRTEKDADAAHKRVIASIEAQKAPDTRETYAAWEGEFLKTLENVLESMVKHAVSVERDKRKTDHPLYGFGKRLWLSRYTVDAQKVLGSFSLGMKAMEALNRQVRSRGPSEADAPHFSLYAIRRPAEEPDTIELDHPTSAGLDVWNRMRQRLVRGQSPLAHRLHELYKS